MTPKVALPVAQAPQGWRLLDGCLGFLAAATAHSCPIAS